MQARVDDILIDIIKDARAHRHTSTSTSSESRDMKALAEYSNSYLSADSKQTALKHLKELLGAVGCVKNQRDVCNKLGELTYAKSCNLITMYDGPEERDASHWRLHLGTGILALPDPKYYDKSANTYEKSILVEYGNMLHKLGHKFGYDNIEQFATMETEYADIIRASEIDDSLVIEGARLPTKFPEINWEAFWEPFGPVAKHWKNMTFVIDSPKWFAHLGKMLRSFTMDRWHIWFRGALLLCYTQFLPANYKGAYNELFMDRLAGIKKESGPMKELLSSIKSILSVPLSRLYISRTSNRAYQQQIKNFIKKLLAATVRRLQSVSWMAPATKRIAIDKVRRIHLGILYPTLPTNYDTPQLSETDIIENFYILGRSLTHREFKDASKKFSTDAWDNPVYAVNAFYIAAGNRLIIPAAIADWPFFDAHATAGWNFGGLGAMIGHEITHAFDNEGRDFDSRGNMRSWWSPKDNRAYNKVTRALIALYDSSSIYDRHVDGTNTLSENLADLGGLSIALDALLGEIKGLGEEERKKQLREFFASYATSWREKMHKASAMQQLIADVHSPAKFRVNNIVRHFDEWYKAFGIDSRSPLYIPPEKRIKIF
jgi:predicted metalloendopeptidase